MGDLPRPESGILSETLYQPKPGPIIPPIVVGTTTNTGMMLAPNPRPMELLKVATEATALTTNISNNDYHHNIASNLQIFTSD